MVDGYEGVGDFLQINHGGIARESKVEVAIVAH